MRDKRIATSIKAVLSDITEYMAIILITIAAKKSNAVTLSGRLGPLINLIIANTEQTLNITMAKYKVPSNIIFTCYF